MSNQELELKFVVEQSASSLWDLHLQSALSEAGFLIEVLPEKLLQNTYYDSEDQVFEKFKMGMRVRGVDGLFEQTLKTQKSVNAGMHSRNEFNVPLKNATPDLTLFPADAWPENFDKQPSSLKLNAQFSTHFTRKKVLLKSEKGECELVFDEGKVETDNASKPINEVEVELLSGDSTVLFKVADVLAACQVRLSDVSKAAQGYGLLKGVKNQVSILPTCMAINSSETTENVFCRSAQRALQHWQYHEHLFFESGSEKMLPEIATGIRLLLQSITLFLPILQCQSMLNVQRDILAFSEKWLWIDELKSMRFLLSKKGPFFKTINKQSELESYIQGRQIGLLKAHNPKALLLSKQANAVKLGALYLLHYKPWQKSASSHRLAITEHAKGWLSQGWQTLHQTMQSSRPLRAANYTSVEALMRQTLFNGFMLADLFPQSSSARAPWLDLLMGIDEVRALRLLKQTLVEADIDFDEKLEPWVDEKIKHLLNIMERTRQVAMSKSAYW